LWTRLGLSFPRRKRDPEAGGSSMVTPSSSLWWLLEVIGLLTAIMIDCVDGGQETKVANGATNAL